MRLGEVEKEMFQVIPCHFELIYGLLTIQECYLNDRVSVLSRGLLALSTNFRPLNQAK